MKKLKLLLLLTIFLLPMTLIGVNVVHGKAQYGMQCEACHNGTVKSYAGAYQTGPLVIDGEKSDSWWSGATYRKNYVVTMITDGSGQEHFVEMIWGQNSTHIAILVEWDDIPAGINGTDVPMGNASDGFMICFNINMATFSARYGSFMNTTAMGGGKVDTFLWKPSAADDNNYSETISAAYGTYQHLAGNVYDLSMDETGWHTDASQSYSAKGVWENDSLGEGVYWLEIVRPLVTGDSNDIQFDHTGNYEFAIAWLNGSAGVDHYVSYVQEVYVYAPSADGEPPIPGFELAIALIPILAIVALLYKRTRKHEASII